jgi:thiol:disulfide interchange protein DsbD
MLATAAWLVSLTLPFYGDRYWWLNVFLVLLALAAWIFGQFVQRGTRRRGLAWTVMALLLVGGFAFVVEGQLQWRTITKAAAAGDETFQIEPGGVVWRKWSPAAVDRWRAAKRPILVDFTAKWCITCNTVVKPSIENDLVRKKLKEIDAIALLADYTLYPPEISAELERFERAAVPLVVVYPADPSKPAMVLPEFGFVPRPQLVLDALERAR